MNEEQFQELMRALRSFGEGMKELVQLVDKGRVRASEALVRIDKLREVISAAKAEMASEPTKLEILAPIEGLVDATRAFLIARVQ